ncbi:MAG: hypothetical protein WCK77_10895 [Verrucomicrobiota bacterium]
MRSRICGLLGCIAALAGADAVAQSIQWNSTRGATNRTSAGGTMTSGFSFELGIFKNGFVPSPANRALWAANWVAAQRVAYDAGPNQQFAAQWNVIDNLAPFSQGTAAYVWGFQGGVNSSEWLLFRKSDWTWPAASPSGPPPFPLTWLAASATAVLGTINASGSPVLMQSAAVTDAASPATTWLQWQASELAGVALNGPSDDPDHDGTSNLLEFVFGTPPTQAGAPPATPVAVVMVAGQRFLQMTVPRRVDHPATLTVQVTSNLANWSSGPAATVVVTDSPAALVVRDLTPLGGAAPQRFMRLKAELATP